MRQDHISLISGIVGVLAATFGIMMASGYARGWNSGFALKPEPEPDRFIDEPEDPTEAGNWYYWRLPPNEMSPLSGVIVWMCYMAHQLTIWGTIYYAQSNKENHVYKNTLRNFNWWALGLNALFHLVHLGQTHWTYDGTAAYVSEASSQGSVIMMLVVVLLMEYRDRGILFNWPQEGQKGRFPTGPMHYMRKYHGYAFAWAVIYTFWYHPMEPTWGHAMGFTLTALLMLQGSLMFTRAHLNKYWRVFIESFVCIHGGLVAVQTGGDKLMGTTLWPMFTFGFSFVFVMTQIHGLPFWKKLPGIMRITPAVIYFVIVIWAYSWIPDKNGRVWVRMSEIVRIPSIEYLLVVLLVGMMSALLKCFKTPEYENPSISRSKLVPMAVFFISYAIMVGVSVFAITIIDVNLITMMVVLVIIYTFFVCVATIALEYLLHRVSDTSDQQKSGEAENHKSIPAETEMSDAVATPMTD